MPLSCPGAGRRPARTRGSAPQTRQPGVGHAWLWRFLLTALALATAISAQQFPMDLDRLAAQASNKVDLSLSGSLLQFAAKFLDDKDPDEAKVRKLIVGLDGIYVKCYSFKTANVWTDADLETVRRRLRTPEWSRIVNFNGEDGTGEIYVRLVDNKPTGIAILATEPKELTIVNIAGSIDLASLGELGGHFNIPKIPEKKEQGAKEM